MESKVYPFYVPSYNKTPKLWETFYNLQELVKTKCWEGIIMLTNDTRSIIEYRRSRMLHLGQGPMGTCVQLKKKH